MNKTVYNVFLYGLVFFVLDISSIFASDGADAAVIAQENDASIPFVYQNEDIVNIINYLAGLLGKNIVLPQGIQALNVKVSYQAHGLYTPEKAWDLLVSLLDVAGYSVIEKKSISQVMKSNKEIAREGLPVYIGADVSAVGDSDQRITYVHYFNNIRVLSEGMGEVQEICKMILPDDAKYVLDQGKNALILAGRAYDIWHLLSIMKYLDVSEFKEKIGFIPLRHAAARFVADLFNEHFLQQDDPTMRYKLDTRKKNENSYFVPHTRMIGYDRTNTLIIISTQQGIDQIKHFIETYIDVEPDSGESVLHVYRLQYLDAEEFLPVLQKIVESAPNSTGQSRNDGKRPSGPERFFDEVIIAVDKPRNAQDLKYYGGNNLIIACRNDDWAVIKDLIESLDLPQDQVFIEILIADLTVEDSRLLGTLMRNPAAFPLFNQMGFQSVQLPPTAVVTPLPVVPKSTLSGDLLPLTTDGCTNDGQNYFTCNTTVGQMAAGSTAISFNDSNGATWTIAQLLQLFKHSKILTHPHVVATHNKETQFITGQYRLVKGDVTGSIGSNTVVKQEPITADLKVYITPRITGDLSVNLDVRIDIEEFIPGSDAKATRSVKTNANVKSETILTLGGLIRTQSTQGRSQTPILGDIPILGYFCKQRSGNLTKNNLTVFISPTIVHARLRKGIGTYTQDYITLAEKYSKESVLFDTIRDPITRLFFNATSDTYEDELRDFIRDDEFVREEAIIPVPEVLPREDEAPIQQKTEAQELDVAMGNASGTSKKIVAQARRVRKKKAIDTAPTMPDDQRNAYAQLKKILDAEVASPLDTVV